MLGLGNINYKKGREKEYRICKRLREEGYNIVQRSAGSHSPVDIWAINIEEKKILLVQSKPESRTEREERKLYKENKKLNGKYSVEFMVE